MGKIIFWIVVFFVILFALRLISLAKAKARRVATANAASPLKPSRRPSRRCAAPNAASSCRSPTPRRWQPAIAAATPSAPGGVDESARNPSYTRRCFPPLRFLRSSPRRSRRWWPIRTGGSSGSSRCIAPSAVPSCSASPYSRICARCRSSRPNTFVTAAGLYFPFRSGRVLVAATAAAAAAAAADAVAVAVLGRHLLPRNGGRRGRHIGRAVADPAVPAAGRRRLAACERRPRSSTPRSPPSS